MPEISRALRKAAFIACIAATSVFAQPPPGSNPFLKYEPDGDIVPTTVNGNPLNLPADATLGGVPFSTSVLPSQATNANKALFTNATTTSWLNAPTGWTFDGAINTFQGLPFTALENYATSIAVLTDINENFLPGWIDAEGRFRELRLGTNLSVSGTTPNFTLNAAGGGVSDGDMDDITISGTGTVYTIDPGAVSLAKMANMATASFIGRSTASTGVPEVLSNVTAWSTLLGTTTVRGLNKTLYLSVRTDGRAGTGTAEDPLNCGGANDAAKATAYTNILTTYTPDYVFIYAKDDPDDPADDYLAYGWEFGVRQTANEGCKHYTNGATIRLYGADDATGEGVIFGCSYNQRADGFEIHDAILNADATAQPKWSSGGTRFVTCLGGQGSNALFRKVTFKGFGTNSVGTECFAADWSSDTATGDFSNNTFDECVWESPATGNDDGLSAVIVGATASGATASNNVVRNSRFILTGNDFLYSNGAQADLVEGNYFKGCSVGAYLEPSGASVQPGRTVYVNNTFDTCTSGIYSLITPGGSLHPGIVLNGNRFVDTDNPINVTVDSSSVGFREIVIRNNDSYESDGTISVARAVHIVTTGSGPAATDVSIENNRFDSSEASAINIEATNARVGENKTHSGTYLNYYLNSVLTPQHCEIAVPTLTGLQGFRRNSGNTDWEAYTPDSGSGTVTDFSAGDLAPLFTTSEATTTTTPALTFALSNAAANTFFGNKTGSSAAPSFMTAAEARNAIGLDSDNAVDFLDVATDSLTVAGESGLGDVISGTWVANVIGPAYGGTGVANNAAATLTRSGNHALTITTTGTTGVTLPTSGTLLTDASIDTLAELNAIVGDADLASTSNPTLAGATLTAQLLNSTAGLASTPAHYMTGAWYAAGTGTTTFPHLLLQATGTTAATTWSTAGTAIGANAVTGFTGNLIDLRLAGAARFSIASTGAVTVAAGGVAVTGSSTFSTDVGFLGTGTQPYDNNGSWRFRGTVEASPRRGLRFNNTAGVYWSNTSNSADTPTVGFSQNGADVIEINTGTAAAYRDIKARTFIADSTITAGGTTGAQTINKSRGTVNFAAAASTLVVTNSLVASTSIVRAFPVGAWDTTATAFTCTAASGSFTITANTAATAETRVAFEVFIP